MTHKVNMTGTFKVTGYEVSDSGRTKAQVLAVAKGELIDYAVNLCTGDVEIEFDEVTSTVEPQTFQVEIGDLFVRGKSEEEVRLRVEKMLDKITGLESWGGVELY